MLLILLNMYLAMGGDELPDIPSHFIVEIKEGKKT